MAFQSKVIIDKSGANTAALEALNDEPNITIEVRQSKYLNNRIE
jgi:putative transposase